MNINFSAKDLKDENECIMLTNLHRVKKNVRVLMHSDKFILFRYLVVGGWNTVFGFITYSVLFCLYGNQVHYLLLMIPSYILSITNAFLCYKHFVFKTQGNAWIQYFKCYLVYGWVALIEATLLYVFVQFLKLHPIVANGISIVVTTGVSYCGHTMFVFVKTKNIALIGVQEKGNQ